MGCGRVGSTLAVDLEKSGHTVAVIDQNREAFRRLGADFNGRTIAGVGFDRDTLLEAGIEKADAFAAVSNGDNSNILAARVARENFGVKNVVARIYDPGRAEIYQRLGIPTVATVLWTTDQIMRRLTPDGTKSEWRDATGKVVLVEVSLHKSWYGEAFSLIEKNTSARVAFITRLGEALLPDEHTVLQEGDLVHLLIEEKKISAVEKTLAAAIEDYRRCKSIIDELQRMLQLASSIRSLTGGGVPPLINYLANLKPGMSATSLLTRFIEKLEDSGVPTGDLPDGSPNLGVVIQQGFNQSLMDEIAESNIPLIINPINNIS